MNAEQKWVVLCLSLTIILTIAKFSGKIDCWWMFVFMPIWAPLVFFVMFMVAVFINEWLVNKDDE